MTPGTPLEAVVTSVYGAKVELTTSDSTFPAFLAGKLRLTSKAQPILPGDHVTYAEKPGGERVVETILPRRSCLSRQDPLTRRELQIMANLDGLLVVFASASPEPDFLFLDRILATAAYLDLQARIVFNKTDLLPPGAAFPEASTYRAIGYPTHRTSVPNGDGLESLTGDLGDATWLLVGPSGTGKSSLLNLLIPGLDQSTREVQAGSGWGKHTTTRVNLFPLRGGGFIGDSPGLREFTLWEIPFRELKDCFPEFGQLDTRCRFDDCLHGDEPDCAVKAAVEAGAISERRHRSYLTLMRERETAHRTRWKS